MGSGPDSRPVTRRPLAVDGNITTRQTVRSGVRHTFLALLLPALLLSACGDTIVNTPRAESSTGMVVVGVGRVEVRPDTLVVSLGVESNRPTAPEALEAMTSAADGMIAAIRDAGVASEDIQTVNLSVREVRQPRAFEVGAFQTVAGGFVGEQRLRIRIKDLERGGEILEAAVAAGGEDARVFSMSLDVDDPDEAIAQARQAAVEDALGRADELASTAGIDLGPPISIEEIRAPEPGFDLTIGLPEQGPTGSFDAATATAGIAARIQPGTRSLEVRVQVRFSIE